MPDICNATPCDRRRLFWSTQPDCGADPEDCGVTCGVPGLRMVEQQCRSADGCDAPPNCDPIQPKTIATDNWVRGLALNILLTDGPREADYCGFRPGLRGGFWAGAFVSPNYRVGSRLRQMTGKGTIYQVMAAAEAAVAADLQTLTAHGVAKSVDVVGSYIGGGRVALKITIIGERDDRTNIGIAGSRIANSWIWTADGSAAA